MSVVTPHWQSPEDKQDCFRNGQTHWEWGDGARLLCTFTWKDRMGSLCRPESAAWRCRHNEPRRAPEIAVGRHIASPHQSCLLFSPIFLFHPAFWNSNPSAVGVVAREKEMEFNKWVKTLHLYYSKIYEQY